MMFVVASSIFDSSMQNFGDPFEHLKQSIKSKLKRVDSFTQLSALGSFVCAQKIKINPKSGLYIASGHGNIDPFQKILEQKQIYNQLPKPIDFINLLSNSAGFGAAKNLFVFNRFFPFESALILANEDLRGNCEQNIFVGGVDEQIRPLNMAKILLKHPKEDEFCDGSNWLYLSSSSQNAIAKIEIFPKVFDLDTLIYELENNLTYDAIAYGKRFEQAQIDSLQNRLKKERFFYEDKCGFYETLAAFVASYFIEYGKGTLIHIGKSKNFYMLFKIEVI